MQSLGISHLNHFISWFTLFPPFSLCLISIFHCFNQNRVNILPISSVILEFLVGKILWNDISYSNKVVIHSVNHKSYWKHSGNSKISGINSQILVLLKIQNTLMFKIMNTWNNSHIQHMLNHKWKGKGN